MWKYTLSFPSRDRSALPASLNQLAVDGTTINFSQFSWADRPKGQDYHNQGRKARVSLVPVIKMGVLLGSCPGGKQVFVTWACGVVPSGLSLRETGMSLDMRLMAVSSERGGSDRLETLTVGLRNPLG